MKCLIVLVVLVCSIYGSTDVQVSAHDPKTGLPYSYSITTLDTAAPIPGSQVPEQLQPVSPFKNNILPLTNLPYNGYPYNTQTYNAVPYNGVPYNAIPYNGIPFNHLPYSAAPYGYNNLNPYSYSAYNPTAFNRGAYNPYYLGYNPVGYKISNQEEPLAEAN
ncbi:uncharacterized protein LOC111704533 [Eurytemora carolleeae]|uniref:uncharacterized protein LOC111704533 n=1 Tax=Eurytemora carolleeae TaxID=1294199 RepID=UPI000C75602C|nr:uncharacterized protein LOC111704533 [Eurytemora carolleeae]|eukprot:XP_023332558.1 uncharacterized protein LOC111704533 [Eurytemora affinis]